MNKTVFEVTESVSENDNSHCIVYGIQAVTFHAGNKIKLDEVPNVSVNLNFVEQLVEKFNQFDLHIEHFRDALYDCICEEYTITM